MCINWDLEIALEICAEEKESRQKIKASNDPNNLANLMSEAELNVLFDGLKEAEDYFGVAMDILPLEVRCRVENQMGGKDNEPIKSKIHLIYLDTTTCKDTYKEFKNIFEYVLSDGAHTPYALLRSENKILGVLKFEGYSHILFFDRFVDRDNALFAYPGAVVNLAFEQNRYLYPDLGIIEYPPDLKESLKSESIIVIDMPSEFYLDFQKSIGRKGNPEDTDYFTNENIENKINQFQAKIQELMTQRKVEVYDGGGFLRTTD